MIEEIDLGDRKITLVGTAHVSKESKEEVRITIEDKNPDYVGIELDEDRYESLREESGWTDLNIVEAIRDGKGFLLLLNLVLSIYQRQMGLEQDVKPGEELLEAIYAAEENEIEYSLIDRDINETFRLAFSELGILEKAKLCISPLFQEEQEIAVEDLKEDNMLDTVVKSLEEEFPVLKKVFLDDRNKYMAQKILKEDFEHAVIVVGAAHVEGLSKDLKKSKEELEIKKHSKRFSIPWTKILKYGIPLAIVSMIAYSFQTGLSEGLTNLGVWIVANSVLAMLGAILAGSSIYTWITSFLISPISSINPLLPAGLVASYVEASVNPPKVRELEDIAEIESYRDLWDNQVGVILLTFFLVNLGSGGAAIISGLFIFLNILI